MVQKSKRRNARGVPAFKLQLGLLVREGDAEPRHSEILIVAAMAGSEFKRLVNDDGAGRRRS